MRNLTQRIAPGCRAVIDTSTMSTWMVRVRIGGIGPAGDDARGRSNPRGRHRGVEDRVRTGQNLTLEPGAGKIGQTPTPTWPSMVTISGIASTRSFADQLTLSLDRLGLARSMRLLHNPEYFLSHATRLSGNESRDPACVTPGVLCATWRDLRIFPRRRFRRVACVAMVSHRIRHVGSRRSRCPSRSHMIDAAKLAATTVGAPSHHFQVLNVR